MLLKVEAIRALSVSTSSLAMRGLKELLQEVPLPECSGQIYLGLFQSRGPHCTPKSPRERICFFLGPGRARSGPKKLPEEAGSERFNIHTAPGLSILCRRTKI